MYLLKFEKPLAKNVHFNRLDFDNKSIFIVVIMIIVYRWDMIKFMQKHI